MCERHLPVPKLEASPEISSTSASKNTKSWKFSRSMLIEQKSLLLEMSKEASLIVHKEEFSFKSYSLAIPMSLPVIPLPLIDPIYLTKIKHFFLIYPFKTERGRRKCRASLPWRYGKSNGSSLGYWAQMRSNECRSLCHRTRTASCIQNRLKMESQSSVVSWIPDR